MRLFYLFLTLILLLFCQYVVAQPGADTIRPGKAGLIVRALKPGLRQYLLCYQNPKTNRQLSFWYWLRDTKCRKTTGEGCLCHQSAMVWQRYGHLSVCLLDKYSGGLCALHSEETEQGVVYSETYWISKKDHQFLKEEDHFSGMTRYKIRMPDMMPDIRAGFDR